MATNCGCGTTSCQTTQCGCQALISSDCVNNVKSNFECLDIASNQTLTATLEQMDAQICALFNSITNYFTILNVGAGAGVYKGVNLLGQKELKSLTKTGDLIVITSSTNEINFTIDEAELTNFINELIPAPPEEVCIGSSSLSVIETAGCFKIELELVSDTLEVTQEEPGTIRVELYIEAGDNVEITGAGSLLNPFVINATDNDTIVSLQNGITTNVAGNGTSIPYSVEINNLQKTVNTFPYTLTSTDDKYTIFIANGVSNVVVNVPNGLVNNFSCVFIQEGSGTVTIQQSGTATLLYPSTTLQNIIKGQFYWAMVEKKLTTDTYYLLGSLLPI